MKLHLTKNAKLSFFTEKYNSWKLLSQGPLNSLCGTSIFFLMVLFASNVEQMTPGWRSP